MRVAVITIAAGRPGHLACQREGLVRCVPAADRHVIVVMDPNDDGTLAVAGGESVDVVVMPDASGRLPLAQARNLGAARAVERGADLLVFLDVDCVPGPGLIRRYTEAAQAASESLLCGPVAYLSSDAPPTGNTRLLAPYGRTLAGRPVPADGETVRNGDHRLFWSLSFAVTAATWQQLGGFSEVYRGYGGEDTDFGQQARSAGIDLVWVGGAWAYHQHHATADPPVHHLDDILDNAATFHARWGWWPMEGWLTAFADAGLARYDVGAGRWVPTRVTRPQGVRASSGSPSR